MWHRLNKTTSLTKACFVIKESLLNTVCVCVCVCVCASWICNQEFITGSRKRILLGAIPPERRQLLRRARPQQAHTFRSGTCVLYVGGQRQSTGHAARELCFSSCSVPPRWAALAEPLPPLGCSRRPPAQMAYEFLPLITLGI